MEIANSILGVFLGVAGLIMSAVPLIQLTRLWIDGGIDPFVGLVTLCLYIVMLIAMVTAPPPLNILVFIIMLITAIGSPWFRQVCENRENSQINEKELDQLICALADDPMNGAVRISLAKRLYSMGRLEAAIEQMEWLLNEFPGMSGRFRPQLETWRREKARQGKLSFLICHQCNAENNPQATECEVCGVSFGMRSGILQRIHSEGGALFVIRGWLITVFTVIVITCLFLFLPIIYSAPLLLAAITVSAYLFLRWVGSDLGLPE